MLKIVNYCDVSKNDYKNIVEGIIHQLYLKLQVLKLPLPVRNKNRELQERGPLTTVKMYRLKTVVDKARPLATVTFRTLTSENYSYKKSIGLLSCIKGNFTSVRNYAAPVAAEPFLNGSSSAYVEHMYDSWIQDPNSVHKVSLISTV